MNIYAALFLAFAKVGACTFGGGYAMLPILQREIVDNHAWATEDDLSDYYAIGQCTPGIIAVNTATFVGQRQKGVLGGIVATLGVVFPSVVIIVLVAAFLKNFSSLPVVGHAFAGVRACVCALILTSVLKLRRNTVMDLPTTIIFCGVLLLAVCSSFMTFPPVLDMMTSPVVLVVLSGICGLAIHTARGWKK